MSFTIREANTDDERQDACTLLQRVYVSDGYTTRERAEQFMVPALFEGQGALLIAVNEDRTVIGVVLFLKGDSLLRQVAGNGEREFRMLGVDASARGRGVGQALIQACIDRATEENAESLVLWTQPTMLAAHRLYARLAFHRAMERDVPDERGFKRIVYVRPL
ncbi:MAG: GNAT family N-acetyltransferase [Flavobacteriales bacterium]